MSALAAILCLSASLQAATFELPKPEGGAAAAIPAAAPLATPLATQTPLSADALVAAAPIQPLAEASALPAAQAAAPQAPGANAQAAALAAGFSAPGGAQAIVPAIYDGNFAKGSIEAQLVAPMAGRDGRVDLSKIATDDTGGLSKKKALKKLARDKEKLDGFQQKFFADKKHKVLIVLQGMDTGGKDGIIKHVLKGLNPQGFKISGFKKPTKEEASHEPLWRIKKALGGPGQITVFNRSHYEDILVPLAQSSLPAGEIEKRIQENNAFEKALVDDGWVVVKLFLHVSKEQNWERLEERRTNKKKMWKLSPDDLVSREHWADNQDAYAYTIGRTNTPYAPWFVIPADKKWYRNYAAGSIIRRAFKRLRLKWPRPANLPKKIPR